MTPRKARFLKYGACGAFTALLAWVHLSSQVTPFWEQTLDAKFVTLCDCFTVPGVLMLCVGTLIAISNKGGLDSLSYVLGYAFRALIPGGRGRGEKYGDYVLRKREHPVRGYGFLLISGALVMGLALIFLIAFYVVS